MKIKEVPEDPFATLEFYVTCPECDTELIIVDVFKLIECPRCGWKFKPSKILTRRKMSQKNPSFRENQ